MPTLYVKKIVSLSPDRYAFFTLEKMLQDYYVYLYTVCNYKLKAKSFTKWLNTEI